MTLNELKRSVDTCVQFGHGNDVVLITLSEPSFGWRASIGIRDIYPGIDWEYGQMRIEPDEAICKKGRAKDDLLPMHIYAYTAPRRFYSCPICETHVKKDDHYCSRCGQHLFFDANREPADSWKVAGLHI